FRRERLHCRVKQKHLTLPDSAEAGFWGNVRDDLLIFGQQIVGAFKDGFSIQRRISHLLLLLLLVSGFTQSKSMSMTRNERSTICARTSRDLSCSRWKICGSTSAAVLSPARPNRGRRFWCRCSTVIPSCW